MMRGVMTHHQQTPEQTVSERTAELNVVNPRLETELAKRQHVGPKTERGVQMSLLLEF